MMLNFKQGLPNVLISDKPKPSTVILVVNLIIIVSTSATDSQLISHFSAKGIRGNVTFAIQNEDTTDASLLITAILETDGLLKPKDERESEAQESSPVYLDWNVHQNTIEPYMFPTCSVEELGEESTIVGKLVKNRPFALDQVTQWVVPMAEIRSLGENTFSEIFWGKSLSLRLSEIYQDRSTQNKPKEQSPSASTTTNSSTSKVQSRLPSALRKPANITIIQPKPQANQKHVFAPRPKLSLSSKFGNSSSTRTPRKPRALAPIFESQTSDATAVNLLRLGNSTLSKLESSNSTATSTVTTSTTPEPGSTQKEQFSSYHKRVIRILAKATICANIVDTRAVKTVEAIFESQISGKVAIRGNEDGTTILIVNLYNVNSKVTTRHDWKILASDILDDHRHGEQCKYLQLVFDPDDNGGKECSATKMKKCRLGDLSGKHGQLQVAGVGKSTRRTIVDFNLPISSLEGSRHLFLAVYESASLGSGRRPSILSCAKLHMKQPRVVEASFNTDGVRGTIRLSQRYSSEPTTFHYNLYGLEGNTRHYSINSIPMGSQSRSDAGHLCSNLGLVYNPFQVNLIDNPVISTSDQLPVGNLSMKHGQFLVVDSDDEDHYVNEHLDLSVQLHGRHSVVGRPILIRKNNEDPWVCANLEYVDRQVTLAVATFYYPVVGRVSFYQLSDEPSSETSVLVDVYNPNSESSSVGHNWMIHLNPAMADFYNWSERCFSSGEVYDPISAMGSQKFDQYERQCSGGLSGGEPLRCRLGDTSLKSGFILSLPNIASNKTRLFYTDPFLPLRDQNSIISRSVVIYDENSPKQRGNRLACSTIRLVHPLKASITSWNSGPSIPSAVSGSIRFEQTALNQVTRVDISLEGLTSNVENYAIHNAWTMDDREFPCSNDSLYDIYDPFDTEHSSGIPPSAHYGAAATVDRVKVGDLSRKHGTFEGLQSVQRSFVDSSTALFAPNSIVGRSLVLRAKVNDFRWVCGNIQLEYDKTETREIVGVASFDDPRALVAGFVRFSQLEHKDGTLSDTYIHVDLRRPTQPGFHEPQAHEPHNWSVFVNQVGEDAYIAADEVRCIAAGFKWNPYLAQDNHENYAKSCNEKIADHLACAMGDLGLRHGSVIVGANNRRALSDSNLPLAGNYSVMGRSLIIFDSKRPSVKLACANILPDIHLKSNVVVKRIPAFTVSRFVEQMRSLLDTTDWLLVPELRATKSVANGECVQMTIHFYGRRAHQLQTELNNLITLGTVRRSTRTGVDTISTHYKLCRATQALTSRGMAGGSLRLSLNFYLAYLIPCLSFVMLCFRLRPVIE